MTKWELEQAKIKTERAKEWLHACGRKDFSKLEQITKDTYICFLYFFNGQGPTEENSDPVLAILTEKEAEGRMKRKRHPKDRSIDANNTASKKAKESMEEISAYEVEALATGSNKSNEVASIKLQEKSDASTQTIYDKSQTQWDYAKQGNLYSSYKHHTTFKALIAVTPNGSACFVSDFYEGSLDDVAITQRCGILDYIGPGDLLLVD
eukprot:gene5641-10866_t